MKAPKEAPKAQRVVAPAGTHRGLCYGVVDLGTQREDFGPQNGGVKDIRKVIFLFELSDEKHAFKEGSEPEPFMLSKEFKFSMWAGSKSPNSLRNFIESWLTMKLKDVDADEYDISTLIGRSCILTVGHRTKTNGQTAAEIKGISPLMKGMPEPVRVNPVFKLSLDPTEYSQEMFESLYGFLQKKIMLSPEFQDLVKQGIATAPNSEQEPQQEPQQEVAKKANEPSTKKEQASAPIVGADEEDLPF